MQGKQDPLLFLAAKLLLVCLLVFSEGESDGGKATERVWSATEKCVKGPARHNLTRREESKLRSARRRKKKKKGT